MATHDYTLKTLGHDVGWDVLEEGQRLQAYGWGSGVQAGDYLILPNPPGTSRYRVDSIRYALDPPDQWFAYLSFAPRLH